MFKGYLLKFGNKILPNEFIKLDSYIVNSNKRTVLSEYYDNLNNLHRNVSPNFKTSIQFTLLESNVETFKNIQSIILNAITNNVERKTNVTFFHTEINNYVTATFYFNDPIFKIKKITDNDVIYNEISYTLNQY